MTELEFLSEYGWYLFGGFILYWVVVCSLSEGSSDGRHMDGSGGGGCGDGGDGGGCM